MLKTLIVDDDVFIHTTLRKMINWEEEGFILCDSVTNGLEAIRMIDAETPDIVITDMNIPGRDGLEVIKHIQENYPRIKVIALSAYDDFQYVKQSLKSGAVDYVLKHSMTPEALLGILRSVQETIRDQKKENEVHQRIAEQIKTGKTVLRQNFIKRLVGEGIRERKEVLDQIAGLELELGARNLVVVAGEIDNYGLLKEKFSGSEINNLTKSLVDIAAEILKDTDKSLISMLEEERFALIFSFDHRSSNQDIFNQVMKILVRIKTTIKRYLNITACFGMDGICPEITEVHLYYQKGEKLLRKKFFEGKDQIFSAPFMQETGYNYQVLEIKDEKQILELIKGLKLDELKKFLTEVFAKIQRNQPNPSSMKMALVTLVNLANKIARDWAIQTTMIYGEVNDPYSQLEKFETLQEVRDWILEIYERLIGVLKLFHLNPEYEEVTKKAIEYIFKNYQVDLSLDDIAEYIGVNSSYLSRKFKKDCGKGVIEYLNGVRIEQAKLLMENGDKTVKEIASLVGFNNYNYFFKVFKDNLGMTPHEYEKFRRG